MNATIDRGPMTSPKEPLPRHDHRIAALIALLAGAAMACLSVGDSTHPVRPMLLVAGVASFFAAGWPLCVTRPDDEAPWWTWGLGVALVAGVGLGGGCALYLVG